MKIWFRPFEKDLANSIEKIQKSRARDSFGVKTRSIDRIMQCINSGPPVSDYTSDFTPPLPPVHWKLA